MVKTINRKLINETYPIQCGKFKLDGGAMFGVVPEIAFGRELTQQMKEILWNWVLVSFLIGRWFQLIS